MTLFISVLLFQIVLSFEHVYTLNCFYLKGTTYVYIGTSHTPGGDVLSIPNTQIQQPSIHNLQPGQSQGIAVVQRIMTQQQHIPGGPYLQPDPSGI